MNKRPTFFHSQRCFLDFLFLIPKSCLKLGVRLIHKCGLYTSLYGNCYIKHLDYLLGKSLFTRILINGSDNALLIKLQGRGLCENCMRIMFCNVDPFIYYDTLGV